MQYEIDISGKKKNIFKCDINLGGKNPSGDKISFTNYYMEINNEPFFGICGEFQYSRYPYQYWDEEILKIKMSGVNIIATYIFWIHHEEEEGIFDWNGNNNIRYFIDLCAKHGLFVFIRIGPFDHGECRNGGIPDWLYGRPFEVRSNDEEYLYYVKRIYNEIYKQVTGLLYKDGGPIIGVQLENEYMHASAPWEISAKHGDEFLPGGKDGVSHMKKLKDIACEIGFDVPIYTSTGWGGAPVYEGEILPLYGGYAFCPWNINENNPQQSPTYEYIFQDYHNDNYKCDNFDPPYKPTKYPYACCEMGSGMQTWYQARFIVPPESVIAQTIQKIAGGCNFVGYYVFHGGSQPVGKHSFFNENVVPKISYDFQAPIGEFGQIKDSYRLLKLIFLFIKDFEDLLTPMATILPDSVQNMKPENIEILRYAIRSNGESGFIFINNYQDHVEMHDHKNVQIKIKQSGNDIVLPEKNGITIKKNISFILPFNFKFNLINLKYTTNQLITKIIYGNTNVYFFFEPEGIEGEYKFDLVNIKNISGKNCIIEKTDSSYFIKTNAGKDCVIEIIDSLDNKIQICTITAKQAIGLNKIKLDNQERIIISNSCLLHKNSHIEAISIGDNEINFSIFPDINTNIYVSSGIIKKDNSCFFTDYEILLPEKKIGFNLKIINNQKAKLKINPDAFKNINDIYLNINYEGDIGNAFIDGKLINDNFYNGTLWEIGLKRFLPDVIDKEIYFYIVPKKKGKLVSFDSAMALKKEFIGEQIADIKSIDAVPEYKVLISFEI